ncbi:2-amino-4-hydroxy-6-hydroxymethyldihydropteridine diphosphokinase [Frondihabitans sp. Leaf304]|uniref:2-amino-4-hydroxy-6- hydroxymethyldihydropteridine diphosphokinase n=1 Tax=Frondihabitans sp. Leaf304 TaxID=1736329 RepID=UPI0006FD5804|nr:2-amino-4-hydroxy-6-hydroxymethyldihydropteridine diphosphokinase [Frondihabitans sp. Leaf304]KQQ25553.1 2-amino-4-hydroxy-6-hydroxymethyldihydropteridine pyrophosphokinase [Frondihabitans sp. Leaf304]
MRPSSKAVVALGSNLGDRDATLRRAVSALRATPEVEVVAASVPIESVALTVDGLDESKPAYLNGAVLLATTLEPVALLDQLNRIENDEGRLRVERWGDRTLDLDLIAYDDVVLDTERLTLPHPRAAERSFVLEPWLQVDPEAAIPGSGPIAPLLAQLSDPVSRVAGAARLDADLADHHTGATP